MNIWKISIIFPVAYAVELVAAIVKPLSFDFVVGVTVHFVANFVYKREKEFVTTY